jgi:molybdate transport system substrate-binding protein
MADKKVLGRSGTMTARRGNFAMWTKPLFALGTAALLAAAPAAGADLKIFVGGAMTETVEKIGAEFVRSSGNKLEYVSDTTGALLNKLKAGEKPDVLVVTATAMDSLQKDGVLVSGSRAELVRALIGVAMKPGAKAPDLSSADAFKKSLLAARSVSYVNPKAGGTSGTYFEGLLAKMGIADAMKPKIVYRNQGSEVADAVAKGDAELGVSFIAELAPNKGVKVAGALPDAIQLPTNYAAAIPTVSANQSAARGFIQAMTSPQGTAVFKAAGLEALH